MNAEWTREFIRNEQMIDKTVGTVLSLIETLSNAPEAKESEQYCLEVQHFIEQWESLEVINGILY